MTHSSWVLGQSVEQIGSIECMWRVHNLDLFIFNFFFLMKNMQVLVKKFKVEIAFYHRRPTWMNYYFCFLFIYLFLSSNFQTRQLHRILLLLQVKITPVLYEFEML